MARAKAKKRKHLIPVTVIWVVLVLLLGLAIAYINNIEKISHLRHEFKAKLIQTVNNSSLAPPTHHLAIPHIANIIPETKLKTSVTQPEQPAPPPATPPATPTPSVITPPTIQAAPTTPPIEEIHAPVTPIIEQKQPIALKTKEEKNVAPRETKAIHDTKAREWRRAMLSCHGVRDITTNRKVVALTFDDGPNGKYTEDVLAILNKHHIHATFFLIGENVQRYPDLVKKLFASQNVIGNHSFSHPKFSTLATEKVVPELQKNAALIYTITGTVPALFRPPYGVCSNTSTRITRRLGYKTIVWNDVTDDYDIDKTSSRHIAKNILSLVKPGGIIALHDGGGDRAKTVGALDIIVTSLENDGYKFLTVPELLHVAPYQLMVQEKLINWGWKPFATGDNRAIDTIVIHSAYASKSAAPYDLDAVLAEQKTAKIATHYMIARDGIIYRLVPDNTIARHAGKSLMPDGRANVNDFSIGITLINSPAEKPTTAQYKALVHLLQFLRSIYKIDYVLGNNKISLKNQTDPWNFDWERLSKELDR